MFPAAKAASFDEPLEMLEACHERIEAQLATLERLLPHLETHGADAQARQAARAVMRYFDTAGADHHLDEEEDLFPVLFAEAERQGKRDVLQALAELEHEHALMAEAYAGVRDQLARVEEGTSARLDIERVGGFASLYRNHIAREAAHVLPFAAQVLDETQRARLGKRMAGRRKIAT